MNKQSVALSLLLICFLLIFTACEADTSVNSINDSQSQNEQTEEPSDSTSTGTLGGNNRAASQDLNIAYILFQSAARAEAITNEYFKKTIEEKGYNWTVTDMDSKASPETLARNIEDAVQRNVDAIVIGYGDLRATRTALDAANQAGIPVFTIDAGWTEGVVVDITSNNYVMSGKVSSYMIDTLGGQGNIVVFGLDPIQATRKRKDTLDAMLKETPGINVLAEHNINIANFYEDTQRAMEDFLQKFGNQIDAVWAPFDEAAMAASDVIQAAGYTTEDMIVVGFDGHDMALERMANPDEPLVATAGQGFQGYGMKMVELIQQVVVENVPIEEVAPSRTIYLDTPLITKFNLPEPGVFPYQAPDFYTGK